MMLDNEEVTVLGYMAYDNAEKKKNAIGIG